ncbi:unnamed protein product, partial [Didymodactylos carnosus]
NLLSSKQNDRKYKFTSGKQALKSNQLFTFTNSNDEPIELGVIDSDDEQQQVFDRLKLNEYETKNGKDELLELDDDVEGEQNRILRSRILKPDQETRPVAHGGASIVIVEKAIRENETLQAFAIRYRVPVSQIKRLNNLHTDQDFYALTKCRIPVRRFGLLHECDLPSNPTVVDIEQQQAPYVSSLSSCLRTTMPVTHLCHYNQNKDENSQVQVKTFLQAMDNDLKLMREKVANTMKKNVTETTFHSSFTRQYSPFNRRLNIIRSAEKQQDDLNCDGADCGAKWWYAIFVIILFALFIPLIYVYNYLKKWKQT